MTTKVQLVRDASLAFQQKKYDECLKIISHDEHHESSLPCSEELGMDIKLGTIVGMCHYNNAVIQKEMAKELFDKALIQFDKVISQYREYENTVHQDQGNVKSIVENNIGLEVFISTTKVNYLAGLCHLYSNRYKDAIPYFSSAALMASTLQSNIGYVANKDHAKSFLKESPKYYLNRGICYNECKNNELAERDLVKYVALIETSDLSPDTQAPLLFVAFTSLASTKLNKNQQEDAIKYFNKAIDSFNVMEPDAQQVHFENFVKAKLKRATTLQKYISYHVYNCKEDANLMKVIESYRKMASDDLETARKYKRLEFYYLYQYVKMIVMFCKHVEGLIEKDELVPLYQDAADKLQECISIQPKNAKLYGDLALCKSKIGKEKLEEILDLYNKSFELTNGEPTDKVSKQKLARIYFERSVIYFKLSNTDKAKQDLDSAIRLNPYFSDAYYNRGFLLKDSEDDIEQTLDDLGATCEMNLEDTECAFLTAIILAKQENKEGSRSIVEEFIKFNPNDSNLKDLLLALNNEGSLDAFESLPKFRESHKKNKLWTPNRKTKPSLDRASIRNRVTSAKLDEQDTDDGYYCDPTFPAVSKSIYGTEDSDLPSELTWYRTWDLCFLREESQLFVDGTSNTDIMQGGIGDCWLLSAFSIVADYPDIMSKIILESKSDPDNGKYVFSIFGKEGPTEVVIDNRLPCFSDSGSLAFSRSGTSNEMWISLLEKAYAAYYGSYQALQSGYMRDALVSLTGGVPFTLDISVENKEEVWEILKTIKKKSTDPSSYCLMGCRSDKAPARTGIQTHHAYAILDCFDCPLEMTNGKRTRLVKLKNPWGYGGELESGDYSDDSKWWTKELRKYVGHESKIDGIFFLTLGALVKYYTQIQGVRIFDEEHWSIARFVDEFKQKPGHDLDDWGLDICSFSSHYVIHNTHEDNKLVIELSQKDTRFTRDQKEEFKCVAIYVFKYPESQFNGEESTRLATIGEENETVVQGIYDGCYSETSIETTLPVGHYVAIPAELYSKTPTEKLSLKIISRKPVTIVRLPVQ